MRANGRSLAACSLLLATGTLSGCLSPSIAARVMLVPGHTQAIEEPSLAHVPVIFPGDGVELRGWLFPAQHRRGTVIFLHGRNQNRSAGVRVAERLVPLGWDVLVYDSRAHGESGGQYSTFGYWERHDLSRAIDFLHADQVVAMGVSLGGAVAIQGASDDPRITRVVAVSAFASMRQVVAERIPPFLRSAALPGAFRRAEALGQMKVDGADTVSAARSVRVPTLLLHGADDRFVTPDHAREIEAALAGPSELVLVPGAGHDDVLASEQAWRAILAWLDAPPVPSRLAAGAAPGPGG